MYDFHKDKNKYFQWQYLTSKNHVIPFIESDRSIPENAKVLEIGCAEAGVLKAFEERGYHCVGIELNPNRVALANAFLKNEIAQGQVEIISDNIYDIDPESNPEFSFDIIILKDVIEHIFDQEKFMIHLRGFLKPNGRVFFGFPPWQMPFGGHQQICSSKLLRILPYFHLLPRFVYKTILKLFKERPNQIKELLEIKETGISIERFTRIAAAANYKVNLKKAYLTNPIYELKFGLKPREQFKLFSAIPYFRNFVTSAMYFVIESDKNEN